MQQTELPSPLLTPDEVCTLDIGGMHCAACIGRVERTLKKVAGVSDAAVNLATNRARVTFDPAQVAAPDLVAAVEKAGYQATPVVRTAPLVPSAPRRRRHRAW